MINIQDGGVTRTITVALCLMIEWTKRDELPIVILWELYNMTWAGFADRCSSLSSVAMKFTASKSPLVKLTPPLAYNSDYLICILITIPNPPVSLLLPATIQTNNPTNHSLFIYNYNIPQRLARSPLKYVSPLGALQRIVIVILSPQSIGLKSV